MTDCFNAANQSEFSSIRLYNLHYISVSQRDDQLHLFDKQLRHFIATYATDLEE